MRISGNEPELLKDTSIEFYTEQKKKGILNLVLNYAVFI